MPPDRLVMLETLVSKSPNDPFPYYCLAQELRGRGRFEDAVKAFEDLRARFPAYVPQYLMTAQVLQELSRLDDARAVLTAGVSAARAARDSHSLGELEGMLASLGA
jgi:predicted Zn-dependent protease